MAGYANKGIDAYGTLREREREREECKKCKGLRDICFRYLDWFFIRKKHNKNKMKRELLRNGMLSTNIQVKGQKSMRNLKA